MNTRVVPGKRGKYILRWTDGDGKEKERSTDISVSPKNHTTAILLLSQLEEELRGDAAPSLTIPKRRDASYYVPNDVDSGCESEIPTCIKHDGDWDTYKQYVVNTHLKSLSNGYEGVLLPIVNKFQRITGVTNIKQCTTPRVRKWIAVLVEEGAAVATMHSYWGHLSAFLKIAIEDDLLCELPICRLPKLDRNAWSKGRSIALEEFERIKIKADTMRPCQKENWTFLLDGLWNSGLRISEAFVITWDQSDFYVDIGRKFPCFKIRAAGQKNRKYQTVPLAPEFAEFLQEIPKLKRHGKIFRFLQESGEGLSMKHVGRIISGFGEKAGVKTIGSHQRTILVDKKKVIVDVPTTASAHDLRRSFATRWALKVVPQVLQKMMRHRDIQTTMKYYVDIDSDDLAKAIYKAEGRIQSAEFRVG